MGVIKSISHWCFSRSALPYWCVLLADCTIVIVSTLVGSIVCYGGIFFTSHFWPITFGVLVATLLYLLVFAGLRTYKCVVRYASLGDFFRVAWAILLGSLLCLSVMVIARKVFKIDESILLLPNLSVLCVAFVLATLLVWTERMVVKQLYDLFRQTVNAKKSFIYGVKSGGIALAKSILNQTPQEFSLVGFVSPDEDLESKYLMGVQVRREGPNLVRHMQDVGTTDLLVSPLMVDRFRANETLIDKIIAAGIRILMIPSAEEWDGKSPLQQNKLKEVEIEDLLPREKIEVDMDAIGAMLKDKRILITGAAGSIGSEISRQVAKFEPAELVLIDQAETPMHDVRLYMANNHDGLKVFTIVSSITDQEHMENIFSEHKPEYVFHAAAYKHVPMMEDNPGQAVRNNVFGTRVIADLAVKYGTKKFVMISTDKAVNPTNVMGCSKRICEIYCQALNNYQQITQFITTRFGNVLGSNGSVIPIFREQIKKGGPVKVTHPDIIRYFMLIPEACRLVLEAGTMGHGGEIFVFDMGNPVKIVDLAKRMIALSGAKDVKIEFTGLRDGEKLYEELLATKENTKPTVHPKIMVAKVREYFYELALRNEIELHELSKGFDDMAIVRKMKEIVPEFNTTNRKYQN